MNELARLSGNRFFALRMHAARFLARRLLLLAVFAPFEPYLLLQVATALARLPGAPLAPLVPSVAGGAGRRVGPGCPAGDSAVLVTKRAAVIGARPGAVATTT